jgi:hypothetical protein
MPFESILGPATRSGAGRSETTAPSRSTFWTATGGQPSTDMCPVRTLWLAFHQLADDGFVAHTGEDEPALA